MLDLKFGYTFSLEVLNGVAALPVPIMHHHVASPHPPVELPEAHAVESLTTGCGVGIATSQPLAHETAPWFAYKFHPCPMDFQTAHTDLSDLQLKDLPCGCRT